MFKREAREFRAKLEGETPAALEKMLDLMEELGELEKAAIVRRALESPTITLDGPAERDRRLAIMRSGGIAGAR